MKEKKASHCYRTQVQLKRQINHAKNKKNKNKIKDLWTVQKRQKKLKRHLQEAPFICLKFQTSLKLQYVEVNSEFTLSLS